MPLSAIEHWLTYHIRLLLNEKFSVETLKKVAFIIALTSCIGAGFVSLISLYAEPWQTRLHYTSFQVNLISGVSNLAGYLTPPILGMLSDSHGPVILSWMAFVGFVPSYFYLSYAFNNDNAQFLWSMISFAMIGISTSALFFSALLTCAKLYPKHKILSISFPTTCYGISSLLGSQLLKNSYFWFDGQYLDLSKVFRFFAWFYTFVGLFTWVSTSIVSMLKLVVEEDEQRPLLEGAADMSPTKSAEYSVRIHEFLRDPSAYLLLLVMFLSLGPLEMFLTNMGSLSTLIQPTSPTVQTKILSYYAASSTTARILVGLAVDFLTSRKISRIWILYGLLLTGAVAQLLIVVSTSAPSLVFCASALCGLAYGGLFTTCPTLTLTIWGDAVFGTAYGSFMIAPALGAAIYGILYARVYDSGCYSGDSKCIVAAFRLTFVSFIAALGVSGVVYWGYWRRRKIDV